MSTSHRARIFQAADGICHICGDPIGGTREKWEVEHVIAFEISRDDSDDNQHPAHVRYHKDKTRKDPAVIAKCKRVEAKHKGTFRTRTPMWVARTETGSKKSAADEFVVTRNYQERGPRKNKLGDLNNHLFAQLERLSDEDLSPERIEQEVKRAGPMVDVADKTTGNAELKLKAVRLYAEHGEKTVGHLPQIGKSAE
ncbi:HNH endonuclease [Ruegeria arenilitoris]|nr:HNH endonuclease signature motif containing protein [Ruegeria arenilitoris]